MIQKIKLSDYELTKSEGLANAVAALLDEKKGKKVDIISVSDKTALTDYFVIASAYSSTAVKSLADYVEEELEKVGIRPLHRDVDAKWIALDYAGVIVHIFYDETRDFYQIERLWADGDNVRRVEK